MDRRSLLALGLGAGAAGLVGTVPGAFAQANGGNGQPRPAGAPAPVAAANG